MKARIIETGEIVEVYHEPQHGTSKMIYKESVLINPRIWTEDELELLNNDEENKHWQDLRERAAIVAMHGIMNFFGSLDYSKETIAGLAVKQADALIKQLKKK